MSNDVNTQAPQSETQKILEKTPLFNSLVKHLNKEKAKEKQIQSSYKTAEPLDAIKFETQQRHLILELKPEYDTHNIHFVYFRDNGLEYVTDNHLDAVDHFCLYDNNSKLYLHCQQDLKLHAIICDDPIDQKKTQTACCRLHKTGLRNLKRCECNYTMWNKNNGINNNKKLPIKFSKDSDNEEQRCICNKDGSIIGQKKQDKGQNKSQDPSDPVLKLDKNGKPLNKLDANGKIVNNKSKSKGNDENVLQTIIVDYMVQTTQDLNVKKDELKLIKPTKFNKKIVVDKANLKKSIKYYKDLNKQNKQVKDGMGKKAQNCKLYNATLGKTLECQNNFDLDKLNPDSNVFGVTDPENDPSVEKKAKKKKKDDDKQCPKHNPDDCPEQKKDGESEISTKKNKLLKRDKNFAAIGDSEGEEPSSEDVNCTCPRGYICNRDYAWFNENELDPEDVTNPMVLEYLNKIMGRRECLKHKLINQVDTCPVCVLKDINPLVLKKTKSEKEFYFGFQKGYHPDDLQAQINDLMSKKNFKIKDELKENMDIDEDGKCMMQNIRSKYYVGIGYFDIQLGDKRFMLIKR